MKCPQCRNETIIFLGIWYVEREDDWILKSHYGCETCRCTFTRPLSENSFYYIKESDRTVVMRPSYVQAKGERRITIVNMDPAYDVRA